VVGASTRPGDELALLRSIETLPEAIGLVLAPRHAERFDEVWSLVQREVGDACWRRSDGPVPAGARVLLLDTLGELAGVLGPARAAFIGGTFDERIGGHSPSEALNAGVPVVAGPNVASDPMAFAGVVRVRSASELAQGLSRALQRGVEASTSTGEVSVCALSGGARVAEMLLPWTSSPPSPSVSPRPWLASVGLGLQAITSTRNRLYDRGVLAVNQVDVPVVSVGSANARGAGKTPAAAWVAQRLRDRGHRVGVALRGYRRSSPGRDVYVSDTPNAALLGDEGAELAALGFLVAAGPDRVDCARALVARGVSVVVLDDGLQHRRLHRDLDLVVVDLDHPQARGALPAGERRERAVPTRAHGVIFIGEGELIPTSVPHVRLRRVSGPWHRGRLPTDLPAGPVVAVCGVGRPGPFVHGLKAEIEVARVDVAFDHQPIELGGELPRVCTAKDAARMGYPDNLWWRGVTLECVGDDVIGWFSRFDGRC
jgi:tetraacyldisaccharide 4'-kinase